MACVEAPTIVATSRSVRSNTSTHGWNTNETTSHSSSGITSEGATAVAMSLHRTSNALERSTRREVMPGRVSNQAVANSSLMASSSPFSSIPRGNNSDSAATSATQSSEVVDHDLQVQQSYSQGETNRPQELNAQSYLPFQALSVESTSYLNYQYQAQASARNASFNHQPAQSSFYQTDSPHLRYPENYVSTLPASSSACANSGSNTNTYPSGEVLPRPTPQPYYKPEQAGLEQQNDHTETNNGGQDSEISNNSVTIFLENFELQQQH